MKRIACLMLALAAAATAAAAHGAPPAGPGADRRAELETRVRERMAHMVQTRLGLTDEQMRKLADVNRKYEERRALLNDQERDIRMAMRDQLLADQPNETRVSELLDRMLRAQRQRFELVEAEQKDLAAFMTPSQRVKYLALQDEARRLRQQMQQRRQGRRNPDAPGQRRRPPEGKTPGF